LIDFYPYFRSTAEAVDYSILLEFPHLTVSCSMLLLLLLTKMVMATSASEKCGKLYRGSIESVRL